MLSDFNAKTDREDIFQPINFKWCSEELIMLMDSV